MPEALTISRRTVLTGAGALAGGLLLSTGAAQDATPVALEGPLIGLPDLLQSCDSIFGVVLLDPDGKLVFEHNADLPFAAASLYKLVLMTEMIDRIEQGKLQPTETVQIQQEFFIAENGEDSYFAYDAIGAQVPIEELIYSTGGYSSNVGAQALMSLTSPEQLDAFARELGMSSTHYWLTRGNISPHFDPSAAAPGSNEYARAVTFLDSFAADSTVNITTPRDIATFFHLLATDTLRSAEVSWRVQDILSTRFITDRLPALLPASVPVVHKTGNLYGVLHDAGYLETPDGPVVAVALAQAVVDYDTTFAVEQRIGLVAWEIGGGEPEPVASPADAVG
ncbi:MAG: class A beta-lactamase-related serine hydrolase [Chloroflexota bacterium]|nr:class A beta-lactamase-related serine hydrolase [Chloroflexota bacterium]